MSNLFAFSVRLMGSVIVVAALAGCTLGAAPGSDGGDAAAASSSAGSDTATVTRADVTPVVTVSATVTSSVPFFRTSRWTGTFHIARDGSYSVTDTRGARHALRFDANYTSVSALIADGGSVRPGLPILQATFTGFVLRAELKPADLLKLIASPVSARAQISGSGGPFSCALLDPRATVLDGASTLSCIIPSDQRVVSGLDGIIAIRLPTTTSALVLPVDAVAGTVDHGEVFLLRGGEAVRTEVTLGASDGYQIAISSGLAAGDVVQLPSPSLLDQQ